MVGHKITKNIARKITIAGKRSHILVWKQMTSGQFITTSVLDIIHVKGDRAHGLDWC